MQVSWIRAVLLGFIVAGAVCEGPGPEAFDPPSNPPDTTQAPAASVVFASYLGGSDWEVVRDIATDAAGNAYLTGGTISPDFPTTAGVLQRTHNPGTPLNSTIARSDVFIVKMDPSGNIVWSTFLGGPNSDRAYAIDLDPQGNVYVAGRAGPGFPVTASAFQTAFQGGQENAGYGPQDGFVCKIRPDGSAIVYCSFFGTSDPRPIRDLAVNPAGEVYVVTARLSGTYPAAVNNAFVNSPAGAEDAVIAKIRADGAAVVWARYLGGSGEENHENSVALDAAGNPYMLFSTRSANAPATAGAYQTTNHGDFDVFVARLNPANGALVWGTYFGAAGNESTETHEFAVDAQGNAYIAAATTSPSNIPTTPGAYRSKYAGGSSDIFVAKISADGSSLLACTLIGGSDADAAEGVAVDAAGNVFFTGTTRSPNFPVTSNAVQTTLGGSGDAVAVKFSPDLSRLLYSTYFGGSDFDYGRAASVGTNGFYFGGVAASSNLPVISARQSRFGGGPSDALIARVRF